MATKFDPTQYYLGGGMGAGRFNQIYRPTIDQVITRMNRPEITGMPGQGTYIDQMSNPLAFTRSGPDIFFQKQRSPLGTNLYPDVAGLGFTPGGGVFDTSEMQPLSEQQNVVQAAPQAEQTGEPPLQTWEQAYGGQQQSGGLLGNLFGGASALDEYMTPEQKAQLQNQGLMSAAMQLLAASGPSRTPVGLGQAIGEAYGAGQKGYTAAQQNLLQSIGMKQKMEEAKATKDMQANVAGFLSQPAPEGVDPKEFKAQQYMKLADIYAARNPEQASKFFDMAQKLMPVSAKPEGKPEQKLVNGEVKMVQYYNDGTFKVVSGLGEVAKPEGQPRMEMRGGQPKMVQYFNDGTSKVIEGASQYNAPSTSITDLEILTGQPLAGTGAAGVAQVQDYRKSGAGGGTTVSVNTGEKGFKNEFDLKKEFNNEPIYKEFQSMKSAFSQIQESLKKENPIGDVAAATKIMKLLDPGSVVRESELGIAMAATGKMDRLTNYVDMWKKGTLLTPTQRNEFNALANELFAASAKAYNDKRNEYAGFGSKYGIDASQALGAPVPVPTFTPTPTPAAGAPVLTWDPVNKKFK
jgi:hypothetical protein